MSVAIDYLQDDFFFFCRECDRPGYQPFLLSNTSGLELFIKQTSDTNTQGSSVFASCALQSHKQGCDSGFSKPQIPLGPLS